MCKGLPVPPLLIALLTFTGCSGQPAEEGGGSPAEATAPAAAPATLQGSYGVFVTNEASGDLTLIDPATHTAVATIPVGKRPRGITPGPDGARVFVALSGSPPSPPGVDPSTLPPPDKSADGIGVVDVTAQVLVEVLVGGSDPEQLAISPDGTRLYVANEDIGEASVLDVASGRIVTSLSCWRRARGCHDQSERSMGVRDLGGGQSGVGDRHRDY